MATISSDRPTIENTAVPRLPCSVDLYRTADIGWRVEQRLKNAAYEAHRRRYAVEFRASQLRINPLLKDWLP
ncbi:MAG TPA: hypothetical protein VEC60_17365 [Reyranella sp.]|nr:hypothetical protein [Reyranella sp.]